MSDAYKPNFRGFTYFKKLDLFPFLPEFIFWGGGKPRQFRLAYSGGSGAALGRVRSHSGRARWPVHSGPSPTAQQLGETHASSSTPSTYFKNVHFYYVCQPRGFENTVKRQTTKADDLRL